MHFAPSVVVRVEIQPHAPLEACEAAWDFFQRRVHHPDFRQHQGNHPPGRYARAPPRRQHLEGVRGAAVPHGARRACGGPGQGAHQEGRLPPSGTIALPAKCSQRLDDAGARPAVVPRATMACAAARTRADTFEPRSRPSCGRRRPRVHSPLWSEPEVARNELAAVAQALTSIPHRYVGQVDRRRRGCAPIVHFYARGLLIKTHPRRPPGGQLNQCEASARVDEVYSHCGMSTRSAARPTAPATVGYAAALLDSPLPWTRTAARVHAARPGPSLWPGAGHRGLHRRPRAICSTSIG